MNKEYFSHEYTTRSDQKIKKLIQVHGMLGYGVWWAIIEDLYINANALRSDCECIAHDLHVNSEIVQSIINDFGLFEKDGDTFYSLSVKDRLLLRNSKSLKASESASYRWRNANALRSESDANANKEKKRKVNKIKVNNKELVLLGNEFNLLFSENFINSTWQKWKDYRAGIKKPIKLKVSEDAAIKQLYGFSNGNESTAKAIIEKSIANGWQGLFELKESPQQSKQSLKNQALDDLANEKNI